MKLPIFWLHCQLWVECLQNARPLRCIRCVTGNKKLTKKSLANQKYFLENWDWPKKLIWTLVASSSLFSRRSKRLRWLIGVILCLGWRLLRSFCLERSMNSRMITLLPLKGVRRMRFRMLFATSSGSIVTKPWRPTTSSSWSIWATIYRLMILPLALNGCLKLLFKNGVKNLTRSLGLVFS